MTKTKQTMKDFLQEKLFTLNNEYNYHMDNNNIDKALKVLDQINIISDIENERI
ncbi:MAG: hypothetical protein ACTSWD_02485 [Candidatus Heimdallarchaeota archaeon]